VPDFFEVVGAQRACRAFTADQVPDADVERILSSATSAPSAENRQPWIFVVVRDDDGRRRIGELTRRAWEDFASEHSARRLEPKMFEEVDRAMGGGIAEAPVLVVVAGDTTAVARAALGPSIWPAVQNLLLAANALGYGSALTTLTTAFADELRAIVGLPDHMRPMAVVPLGHPARLPGRPRRQPVATKTHREQYGTAW